MAKEPSKAKERIITGAEALLKETGYEGFSLRKLGTSLGLTAAAVYIHFEDKDALIRAVLDREFAQAAPLWFAAHPLEASSLPYDRLMSLVHFYLFMGLSNPASYRIRFFHDRGVDAQIKGWSQGIFAEYDNARHLFGALTAWNDSAGGSREPVGLYLEVWGLMHGLILALAPAEGATEIKISTALQAVKTHLRGLYA